MQNYLKQFVFLTGLTLSGVVAAESASDSLTRIEAETLVLKAREKQLDVQAKIVARQQEIASKQAESQRVTQAAVSGNPVILSIEGLGHAMFATLQMDRGDTVDVQAGDTLSNGMKIVSIRPNEVIIENSKKARTRLAAASQAPASFDSSFPSAGLRLPLPPLTPPIGLRGAMK